jgi:hypothetical protein
MRWPAEHADRLAAAAEQTDTNPSGTCRDVADYLK